MPVTTTNSVWRGDDGIHLQPTYPRLSKTAKGSTVTLAYRGPYASIRTHGPDIGDELTLGDFGFEPSSEKVWCNSRECQPDAAGLDGSGTLTVVYTNLPDSGAASIQTGGSSQVIEEVEWATLERRLESHPRYNNTTFAPYGFNAGTTTFTKNSGGVISIAEFWDTFKRASTSERPDLRGEIPPAAADLLSMIDDLTKKFMAGTEAYVAAAPVARKTTRGPAATAAGSCGARSTSAPISIAPAGYQWLKTADRVVRQGPSSTWERVEEWTGAKTWDSDLYGSVI